MRFGLLTVMIVAGTAMAIPAMAQNNTPLYVVPNGSGNGYYATDIGSVPVYNNAARPLPMEQMVAGKNAPSYNYNTGANQPFAFNASPSSVGTVSQMRAQRDALAQQYEAQYLKQAQNQQGQNANQGMAANLYNNLLPQEEKPKPTKKRLVYRERNNALEAPPRLFNPDQ